MFSTGHIARSALPCSDCMALKRCPQHPNLSQRITSLPGYRNDEPIRHHRLSDVLVLPALSALIFSPALPDRTREQFHPSPKTCAAIRKMAPQPSFLCTFCWVPQFPPAKPKVLGKEARIACEPCWKAVLDLSICWVCGEMIVRGEDVVSLGWVFMHARTCFCCLFCMKALDIELYTPLPESEEERDGSEDGIGKSTSRRASTEEYEEIRHCTSNQDSIKSSDDLIKKFFVPLENRRERPGALELEIVPVCAECECEEWGEKQRWDQLWNCMQVKKIDGGLSDSRAHMLRKERKPEEEWLDQPGKQYLKAMAKRERQAEKLAKKHLTIAEVPEETAAQDIKTASSTTAGKYGVTLSASPNARSKPITIAASRTTHDESTPIYLNVMDPLGESAFKPSSTKPIPRWMRLFPGHSTKEKGMPQSKVSSTSLPTNPIIFNDGFEMVNSVHTDSDPASESPNALYRTVSHSLPTEAFVPFRLDFTRSSSPASAQVESITYDDSTPPRGCWHKAECSCTADIQTRRPSHHPIERVSGGESPEKPLPNARSPTHPTTPNFTPAKSTEPLTTLYHFPVHKISSKSVHQRHKSDITWESLRRGSERSSFTEERNRTHVFGTSAPSLPTLPIWTMQDAGRSSVDLAEIVRPTLSSLTTERYQQKSYRSQIPDHDARPRERVAPVIRRGRPHRSWDFTKDERVWPERKGAEESKGSERRVEGRGQGRGVMGRVEESE